MPTLRRILKYTPAVVLGLLVVAWGVSLISVLAIYSKRLDVLACYSTIDVYWHDAHESSLQFHTEPRPLWLEDTRVLGTLAYFASSGEWGLSLPILLLISAILPFTIGPFLSFRFRIWHYLAYTALVAVELAYYLQWQE